MIIYLVPLARGGPPKQTASNPRMLPFGRRAGNPFLCLVLHHLGFILPLPSLEERWALTPPFHPCPLRNLKFENSNLKSCKRRYFLCDTFRQPALKPASRRFPAASCLAVFGLSSPSEDGAIICQIFNLFLPPKCSKPHPRLPFSPAFVTVANNCRHETFTEL